ncbi:hypothetical protein Pla52o_33040 [Novipirellula galeiformis]|uniref:Uncharacterized protein n=1 Tax=Novipirellula galeiformis TaxID=2528004 RepID=A0A5C6CDD5_9BACT|nr:hypothetical protein [Novipirellula galeiformis]TWU22248.1 hypothetical protein Pla52o_33040 [Novipirellula galeiformis]
MIEIARHRALALLSECTGDEIWSVEHCHLRRVPEHWIEEDATPLESGFRSDNQTIYVGKQRVNQYHGVRDVDLAVRIGRALGLDVERITANSLSRRGIVLAIKEAIMDGE